MEVFRLSRRAYAEPLSGKGAAMKGARWNSIGVELIYTAQNRSLAMAEVAVHLTVATLPDDYVMSTIHIPDDVASSILSVNELPTNWNAFPHPPSTQKFGDEFVMESKQAILHVPSVVTKGDWNILINPKHRDFERMSIVQIEPFPFDSRMFKSL